MSAMKIAAKIAETVSVGLPANVAADARQLKQVVRYFSADAYDFAFETENARQINIQTVLVYARQALGAR